MSTLYDVGDTARCTAKVRDAAGALQDPATLTFEVTSPSGTVTSYAYPADAAVVRVGKGDFYFDVDIEEPGPTPYRYRWTAAGGDPPVPSRARGELPVRGA